MNDMEIEAIKRFAAESLFAQDKKGPKYCFDYWSYYRWAVSEILAGVMDHPMIPAYETVMEFSLDALCRAQAGDEAVRFIFSVAAEAADDILEMLQ